MHCSFQMSRDILILFLISACSINMQKINNIIIRTACSSSCEGICRERGHEGLNCCSGTQGGYGENGKYDLHRPACRRGYCDLRDFNRYAPSLLSYHHVISCFLSLCRRRYECSDLHNNCDDLPDDGSSEEEPGLGKLLKHLLTLV